AQRRRAAARREAARLLQVELVRQRAALQALLASSAESTASSGSSASSAASAEVELPRAVGGPVISYRPTQRGATYQGPVSRVRGKPYHTGPS
ncbi:MAG: hypothetical protein HOV79_15680, partial [Hamadaea sp.]|nr:hypothetical protein [Hamadaea sp.]